MCTNKCLKSGENVDLFDKLEILSDSAKYDVACTSSGTDRSSGGEGIGNAAACGICHSFAADGRCISLLKVLMSNACVFDCKYCVNRVSNDVRRATFSPRELAELTMNFYRRNYIEGLFLSSGVVRSPDYTMERMLRVVKELRTVHRFGGYIHMKSIPGSSRELVMEAGRYADRLSVNVEIPTEANLRLLAPDKSRESIYTPMSFIHQGVIAGAEERRLFRSAPPFAPAGQSTQMIVGATDERLSSQLYRVKGMRRVYYSGFVPVNSYDKRLPSVGSAPLVRENRLYQADWLMRFYGFTAAEIADDAHPDLDLEIDPKLAWALRHPEIFPVDVNRAEYGLILRVPGIGVKSARMIVTARRSGRITADAMARMGVVMKKARYFVTCGGVPAGACIADMTPERVRRTLVPRQRCRTTAGQLSFAFPE